MYTRLPGRPPTISTVSESPLDAMRLPRGGEREPRFGLTRSYLNFLILPNEANDFTPPVKSYVIKRPGARTGVRLVDVKSLTAYILRFEQPTGKPEGAASLISKPSL